jgi:hypothetical protein
MTSDDEQVLPPYDERSKSADVTPDPRAGEHGGARVGGATGPVESDPKDTPEPASASRPGGTSPAEEQPADETSQGRPSDEGVGPAHQAGVPKGEDHGSDG